MHLARREQVWCSGGGGVRRVTATAFEKPNLLISRHYYIVMSCVVVSIIGIILLRVSRFSIVNNIIIKI